MIKISIAKNNDGKYVLISKVEKNNTYYCIDCDNILIPKLGKKRRHHFSHKQKLVCTGETWQHYFCKEYFKHYKELIKINSICRYCSTKIEYMCKDFKIETEYKYKKYFLDCALTFDNTLKICVEIQHTHKTELEKKNTIINDNILFFEFTTKDIIEQYNISNNIDLNYNELICDTCKIKQDEKQQKYKLQKEKLQEENNKKLQEEEEKISRHKIIKEKRILKKQEKFHKNSWLHINRLIKQNISDIFHICEICNKEFRYYSRKICTSCYISSK